MRRLWMLLPLTIVPAAFLLLGDYAGYFMQWWLTLLIIGIIWWPVTAKLLPGTDNSWIAAKAFGLAFSSYISFFLNHLFSFVFDRIWLLLILALTAVIIWLPHLLLPPSRRKSLPIITVEHNNSWFPIALMETIFAMALLFFIFTRGLKPELDSLEKFMNIGFMNSIWRSELLPAADMWLSGENINYYYFGHYSFTWLARAADIKPIIAYQLAMASLPAFTLSLTMVFAMQIRFISSDHNRLKNKKSTLAAASLGAAFAGLLTVFGGNQHAFLFDKNSPGSAFTSFLLKTGMLAGEISDKFWFANSTRYIGYNPETTDKTIHEFPYYSYLVADLHAHVINLIFVLVLLLLAASFFRVHMGNNLSTKKQESFSDMTYFILASVLLAIFMMANFWDFIIYFALLCLLLWIHYTRSSGHLFIFSKLPVFLLQCLLILLIFLKVTNPWLAVLLYIAAAIINMFLGKLSNDGLTMAGARMGWLFACAHLFALPFNIGFEPIAKSIKLVENRTPAIQLWVLWGAHLTAGFIYIIWLLLRNKQPKLRPVFPPAPEQRAQAQTSVDKLTRRIKSHISASLIEPADQLLLALYLMGCALIALPEIVYVVDIYSGDFKRANTMFKFTYQAFVLLSIVWGGSAARMLIILTSSQARQNRITKTILPALLIIMLIVPSWYPFAATSQWLGKFSLERWRGLDALTVYATKDSANIDGSIPGELAGDVAAIKWLNANVQGQPIIVEANGDSYTDYNRISAFTGLPAVMGWQTHEWLWRTSDKTPDAFGSVVVPRQQVVKDIYTTPDQELRRNLLKEFEVEYIVIGQLEREKYSNINENDIAVSEVREDLISQIATVVFEQADLRIFKVS